VQYVSRNATGIGGKVVEGAPEVGFVRISEGCLRIEDFGWIFSGVTSAPIGRLRSSVA
jgi:hypothetical protein